MDMSKGISENLSGSPLGWLDRRGKRLCNVLRVLTMILAERKTEGMDIGGIGDGGGNGACEKGAAHLLYAVLTSTWRTHHQGQGDSATLRVGAGCLGE